MPHVRPIHVVDSALRASDAWRQSNSWTISVSTRAGVARLDELFGLKS